MNALSNPVQINNKLLAAMDLRKRTELNPQQTEPISSRQPVIQYETMPGQTSFSVLPPLFVPSLPAEHPALPSPSGTIVTASSHRYLSSRPSLVRNEETVPLTSSGIYPPTFNIMDFSFHQMCIVEKALQVRFGDDGWTNETWFETIRQGRLCPPNSDGQFIYYFQTIPWLTGTVRLNKWFCWPCVLCDRTNLWAWDPTFWDSKYFLRAAKQHENTNEHKKAWLNLKLFESRVYHANKAHHPHVSGNLDKCHDSSVFGNSKFMKLLIEVICSMKKKINNVHISLTNYVAMVELVCSYNGNLEQFIDAKYEESERNISADCISAFGSSVILCIKMCLIAKVRRGIQDAKFVYILFEDLAEIVDKSWLAVIVRYIMDDGKIQERFFRFFEIGYDRSPLKMFNLVNLVVAELNCCSKLVAFTYGGTFVSPVEMMRLNKSLHLAHPTANFFPSRDANLSSLIYQAASHVPSARGFLESLIEMSNFFRKIPEVMECFNEFLKGLNDHNSPITNSWDLSSGFVTIVTKHYVNFSKFFESMVDSPGRNKWDRTVVARAVYFLGFLPKPKYRFLLVTLERIFSLVNPLVRAVESTGDNTWIDLANDVLLELENFKNNGIFFVKKVASTTDLAYNSDLVQIISEYSKPLFKDTFQSIIDSVIALISNRSLYRKLTFMAVLQPSAASDTPDENRASITSSVSSIMNNCNLARLKSQYQFFQSCRFFKNKSIAQAIKCMRDIELTSTMAELHSFLLLRIIVPDQSDKSSYQLKKRIKMYAEANMRKLNSSDALMWIERDLMDEMQSDEQFFKETIAYLKMNTRLLK